MSAPRSSPACWSLARSPVVGLPRRSSRRRRPLPRARSSSRTRAGCATAPTCASTARRPAASPTSARRRRPRRRRPAPRPRVAPVGARRPRDRRHATASSASASSRSSRGDLRQPRPSGAPIARRRGPVCDRLDDVIDALDVRHAPGAARLPQRAGHGVRRPRPRPRRGARRAAAGARPDRRAARPVRRRQPRARAGSWRSSDRVVAGVARRARAIGRLVSAFGETLDDARHAAATSSARPSAARRRRCAAHARTLIALEDAAVPLIPPRAGCAPPRRRSPRRWRSCRRSPTTPCPRCGPSSASRPQLRAARHARARPVVRELRPLAGELSAYTSRRVRPVRRRCSTTASPTSSA